MDSTTRCKSQAKIQSTTISCELRDGHSGVHQASVEQHFPSMREGKMTWAGGEPAPRPGPSGPVFHDGDLTPRTWTTLVCERRDVWLPASGGTEAAFRTRTGRRLLYVFNPARQEHRYLDLGTDMVLDHSEAALALDY